MVHSGRSVLVFVVFLYLFFPVRLTCTCMSWIEIACANISNKNYNDFFGFFFKCCHRKTLRHTHTHIYIYIYMCVYCVGADRLPYYIHDLTYFIKRDKTKLFLYNDLIRKIEQGDFQFSWHLYDANKSMVLIRYKLKVILINHI